MAKPTLSILMPAIGIAKFLVQTVRENLEKSGGVLVGTDLSPQAPTRNDVHHFYETPRISDPTFEARVLEICDKHSINAILPKRQQEFIWWNEFFKRHPQFKLLLSGRQTIDICNDKLRSYNWLKLNDFPVSRYAVKNRRTFEDVKNELGPLPWFGKPFDGSASKGAMKIESKEDFEKAAADTMLQPYLKGQEYTINCYVDKNHKCRAVIPHKRIEVADGEVSVGITVKNEYLMDLGRRLAEKLPDSYGPLNFQVIHDTTKREMSDKTVSFTDLNARFGGGYPLVHAAGGNFVEWLVLEAQGKPLPENAGKWQDGLKFFRNNGNFMFAQQVVVGSTKPVEAKS